MKPKYVVGFDPANDTDFSATTVMRVTRRRGYPPIFQLVSAINNTTQMTPQGDNNMDKHIHRPQPPIKQNSPFILHRVGTDGTSSLLTDANTIEQAHDLARSDRARLRDLNLIQSLERHDVVTKSTGQIRPIPVPR